MNVGEHFTEKLGDLSIAFFIVLCVTAISLLLVPGLLRFALTSFVIGILSTLFAYAMLRLFFFPGLILYHSVLDYLPVLKENIADSSLLSTKLLSTSTLLLYPRIDMLHFQKR